MKSLTILIFFSLSLLNSVLAQDSNWVELFNGTNFDGWYSYIRVNGNNPGTKYDDPATDSRENFEIINKELVFITNQSEGTIDGYIATDKQFSEYHFRVEYKLGNGCTLNNYCKNSGLLYHIKEDGIWGAGMSSIESNMYFDWPTATASIGNVRFTSEKNGFGNFGPEADKMNAHTTDGEWNTMEIIVWGDSLATHLVNGVEGGVVSSITYNNSPIDSGRIGLQLEGNDVSFRNPMVRILGNAPGCGDTNSTAYDKWSNIDNGSCTYIGCKNPNIAEYFCGEKPDALPCVNGSGYDINDVTDRGDCEVGVELAKNSSVDLEIDKRQSILTISSILSGKYEIGIYDALGNQLAIETGVGPKKYSFQLKQGIYFVKISAPNYKDLKRVNLF